MTVSNDISLVHSALLADLSVTQKSFNFAHKNNIPFFFVSASDGTNVVRVFTDSIRAAVAYKEESTDILDQIMLELEVSNFFALSRVTTTYPITLNGSSF